MSGAGAGWLEDAAPSGTPAQPSDPVRAYVVQFEALAAVQAEWIEAHTGLAIRERIQSTLALGPMVRRRATSRLGLPRCVVRSMLLRNHER